MQDRTAQRSAKLIIANLWLPRGCGQYRALAGEKLVAQEVVGGAVDTVRSALDDHVDQATCIAADLSICLRLHRELIDRVDRKCDTCNTRDAALVRTLRVMEEVVVVGAVNLPVILVRSRTVQ